MTCAPLITASDLKASLHITHGQHDSHIARLAAAADRAIREWCNRPDGFCEAERTEYSDGGYEVVLTYTPVASIESVTLWPDTQAESDHTDGTAFDAGTGAAWPRAGLYPYCRPGWPEGRRSVKVVYTGGYADIPADLIHAAHELGAMWYRESTKNTALQSETIGSYSYTLASPTDGRYQKIFDLLTSYRRMYI